MVRRILSVVVLAGALALVAGRATANTSGPLSAGPCTPSAVTAHLTNIVSVQQMGCESTWAYVWASVNVSGTSNQVGVTELLSYVNGGWQPVSRAKYCQASTLPSLIYREACFSN